MSTLTGQYISQSYGGLIQLSTNTGIVTGSNTQLQDGFGTNLGVWINGQGNISASSFTGTSSFAISSSISARAISSSFATNATTSSFALNATSASFALNATSASFALNATSASFAVSASWAPQQTFNTGSFATTGSNTFVGNQVISGSVSNEVRTVTISSNTASINLSTGNLFTLTLANGANTHISASNIQRGQTTSIQITQGTLGTGTVTFSSAFSFPSGSSYIPFASSSAIDLISFISFDNTKLRAVSQNNFI
jgi:hypothetical protein